MFLRFFSPRMVTKIKFLPGCGADGFLLFSAVVCSWPLWPFCWGYGSFQGGIPFEHVCFVRYFFILFPFPIFFCTEFERKGRFTTNHQPSLSPEASFDKQLKEGTDNADALLSRKRFASIVAKSRDGEGTGSGGKNGGVKRVWIYETVDQNEVSEGRFYSKNTGDEGRKWNAKINEGTQEKEAMPIKMSMNFPKGQLHVWTLGVRVYYIWMFPKIGVPQNGWFIMENPIKMDDLGVPPFLETPIYIC